jgi:FkbM family methyltransferase
MKISIVSPSFNQVAFIDAAIGSVAQQTHADKEHIIVDGGSTDGCVKKIREAAQRHPHVRTIIEPDRGQADAINKGLTAATGDVLAWINTDDSYAHPEVFAAVAQAFAHNPTVDLLYARGRRLDASGKFLREAFVNRRIDGADALKTQMGVFQPSVFFRRPVFEKVGGLSEAYNLQLDYEYWIRMLQAGVRFQFVDSVWANAVVHDDAKSTRDRLRQLSECLSLIEDKYGEVPDIWIDRFARFYATQRDDKVTLSNALSNVERETSQAIFNTVKAAVAPSRKVRPRRQRIIVTSFDSKYMQQGLNLIASLHRTSIHTFDQIVVYALDFSEGERALLNGLEKVRVVDYPHPAPAGFPDFYVPKGRAYKVSAIAAEGISKSPGDLVLWMDAGLSALMDIDEVFRHVEETGFFITDHDDSKSWPFFNIQFLHRDALAAIGASNEELLGQHLCSCIIGYAVDGPFQNIIDEAARIGRRRDAVIWPKVLHDRRKARDERERYLEFRERVLADKSRLNALSADALYDEFPYYGHRTQSIYSILCYRHGAPVYSATLFHKSNDHSGRAAKENWQIGADIVDARARRNELSGVSATTRIYHHRGVYSDLSGLLFERADEPAFIVGNGPSLRDFDFQKLRGKVWIGMNAAYRYWDEKQIYPYIYTCFDLVVQDSHKEEIRRLIENRAAYGIRWFFLRQSFKEFWPESATLGCVFFLEDLQRQVEWFDRGKVTTGSFSLYVLAFLGFSEIYMLGVDLKYVEQIKEAKIDGRELVIGSDVTSNPNYFFDGYQRAGDRYNPPNRHPDMHVRSWAEAADELAGCGIDVANCNPQSAVRNFPFVDRERTLAAVGSKQLKALRASQRWTALRSRQGYWRKHLLAAIEQSAARSGAPLASQGPRPGAAHTPAKATSGRSAPQNARSEAQEFHRGDHVNVDESAAVAALLSARRGRQHVMLDVGAHFGGSCRHFLPLGWSIYCFEPDPANRANLQQRMVSAKNVVIDPRALGESARGNAPFYSSPESTGISALHAFRPSLQETTRVEVVTAAQIVAQRNLSQIDFLKIDVEGFDFAVLKGVPWNALHPDVIVCEFEDAKTVEMGHTWRDIAAYLSDKGYAIYVSEWHPVVRYGIRHDWRRIVPLAQANVPKDGWGNLLAFKTDPGFAAVADAVLQTMTRPAASGAAAVAPNAVASSPSDQSIVAVPPQDDQPTERFYAKPANYLKSASPRIFALLRFAKKCAGTVWRRRAFFAPLAFVFAAWAALGFLPSAADAKWIIWGSAAFGVVLAALTYLAFRTRAFMERMLNERMTWLSMLDELNAQLRATEHRLTTSAGESAKNLSRQIGTLERTAAERERRAQDAERAITGGLSTEISSLRAQSSELQAEMLALASQHAALRRLSEEQRLQSEQLLELLEAQRAQTELIRAHLESQNDALRAEIARVADDATSLRAQSAALGARVDATADQLNQSISLVGDQLNDQTAALGQGIAALATDRDALNAKIESVDKHAVYNNALYYQRFNRRLTDEHIAVLKRWTHGARIQQSSVKIGYAAARACIVEQRMQGRLATSIEDVLLRTFAAMRIERRRLEILEIGTLFGIGAGIMYDALAPHFSNVKVTLIDPLDGYYSAKRRDILTGQPITEETLRRNLAEVDLVENLTVIKKLSTNDEALTEARKRAYDVLVIDGDHTYQGVRADFERYAPLVRRGGIVIFDDYSSGDWPDVKRYVDAEVEPLAQFERVGHEWRTCVYRKRPRQPRDSTAQ